jgi:hypothetical protein
MSHTDTEQTSRRGRRDRAGQPTEQPTGEQPTGEQPTGEPTGDGQAEQTPEQIAQAAKIAAVQGFTPAADVAEDFRQETTPVRARNPVQSAMDIVAEQAYHDWTAANRPSVWKNMPVITYFLDPGDVADYRKLIRRACELVTPEPYEKDGKTVEPSGVRARFGKEFVLSEKMAGKIGKPEAAGKTVLAWAAIDKRHNPGSANAATDGNN